MTDVQIIDAETMPAALPEALQGIARRYVSARRRANEATLEAAGALAEARKVAEHGEWYTFLQATNTSEDLADRLLAIHATAQQSPQFREVVDRGWLPDSTAALLARPSTPPEVRDRVVEQAAAAGAAGVAPPARRQVEQEIKAARPNPAPVRDVKPAAPAPAAPAPAPAAPLVLTPAAPVPLTPLTPAQPVGGEVEEIAAAGPDLSRLRAAEALIALLEQAAALAYVERDRARHELGSSARLTIPDEAVEAAARTFMASPAMRSAASFLAMSAREE